MYNKKEIRKLWALKKAAEEEKFKKEKLTGSIFCFLIVLFLLIWSQVANNNSEIQNGLFITCVILLLTSITLFKIDISFFEFAKKVTSGWRSLSMVDKTNLVWLFNFIISIIGLFMVDVSFFNSGFRIPTIVAITIAKILSVLFLKKN